VLRLRGVRHNNLKGFDLDLPLDRLIVVSGLSGSGKSSLAFDTLFAEGQRRYVETFSPYARQFFDRMDKPRVDHIEGIPPAIAIEQRNSVRSTRSTVGTMTELCDYAKVLWAQVAQLVCRKCGRPVGMDSVGSIWSALPRGQEVMVTFDLPLAQQLSLRESLELVARQGYQRLWHEGEVLRVDEAEPCLSSLALSSLTVIQDKVRAKPSNRARFAEAGEQAYHFGKGRLAVWWAVEGRWVSRQFSLRRHCPECDLDYREPVAALFSFNHPLGACPTCRGFGRTISIDYQRALPDRSKTLAGGVVKPWQSGMSAECQRDLMRFCRKVGIPTGIPFRKLPLAQQRWVIEGDPDYGQDQEHEWPRAWYGVKGYFRWLESKSYKMHVRVLLSRYRAYVTCTDCGGRRFQPEALDYRLTLPEGSTAQSLTLADFYRLTVCDALGVLRSIQSRKRGELTPALEPVLGEMESRLAYLDEVGLGYLSLDRPTRSLSGGETERVNLATCLGTRLVNTLYVLDEPSVGLHARDTARLVKVLERLRNLGNTVVVVEHEPSVIKAADEIVDLGPGRGAAGGEVVFQGSLRSLLRCRHSLTGQYLSRKKVVGGGRERGVSAESNPWITMAGVNRHNLRDFSVKIPLDRLVCITGVSGSGKSTLVREALHGLMLEALAPDALDSTEIPSEVDADDASPGRPQRVSGRLEGWQPVGEVVLVDQSPIGRTPRSNPAVYVGAFDAIRELYSTSDDAERRGLGAGAFSFNSPAGQCPRCRGAGFEKIEMQFLSDVFVRCPECDGRRYLPHVLEVLLNRPAGELAPARQFRSRPHPAAAGWNIARMLEATVDEAREFLSAFQGTAAVRAAEALAWLGEVGLGYLQLGQPINTLSGGESQRLKLVGALAESSSKRRKESRSKLYLLDEPTTGLHFDDVRVLLEVLQRLVDLGHSVMVIEHNLEVIRAADWVIDLGPEAGDQGGRIVVEGTPDQVAACADSHTGRALRE
jgi:excinuclease ABC subunit A